ncbi:MAG TPA: alpha-galactosidase [Terracidiphilus sp.]|nr:alpha-galactosidase [Terracidiphilus sp.]
MKWIGLVLADALLGVAGLHGATAQPPTIVANKSVIVALRADPSEPRLVWFSADAGKHFSNSAIETLPSTVETDGKSVPVMWHLLPKLGHSEKRRAVFVYETGDEAGAPKLQLSWEWKARADFGPVEHRVTVKNLSGKEVWLPMIDSLALEIPYRPKAVLKHLYVEKGADTPSAVGTHIEDVADGYRWEGHSSTYAFPRKGEAREIIPAEFVWGPNEPEAGWFAGIEFSGRTRIALKRNARGISTVLGLDPEPGPFRTRIAPGEAFTTPTVFLGTFTGGPDGAANELHAWVRAVLGNAKTWSNPRYPYTVNNSWGGGMDVNEAIALRMIADAKDLGLEMFHMDAGWFRGVGDWYPDPKKFPHGLAYVADAAHKAGLKFGLWVDWTQAGVDTEPGALNVHDPKVRDWLVTDLPADWKPEAFKGQTADVGVPAAHDYFAHEVERIVTGYHLDMLEHDGYLVAQGCMKADHPHAPPVTNRTKIVHDSGFDFALGPNSTDVSYHAVRAYYDIYEQMRRRHPGLLFEICNDGGRMVDFGTAAHGDYFSITDTYDPLSNRRAFYDTSYMLPPAMLESYVEKWPTPHMENFLYMLRSGMMGWLSVMIDTTSWTQEQHAAAKREIAFYKETLRPLIRDAKLYHVSARPDGVHWDGMEYWDAANERGVVFAFRGSAADEDRHAFVLRGLEKDVRYHLHFEDGSAPDTQITGAELMSEGIHVHLKLPLSSEIVVIAANGH